MNLIAKDRLERGKELEYRTSKTGLDVLGNDWGRVQGVEVLKDLANNPGASGAAAAGAGIGMGIGAGSVFGSIAQQAFAPAQNGFAPQQPAPSGSYTQIGKSKDKKANKEIERAYDLLHSSPTKSNHSVKDIESDILSKIGDLKDAVGKDNAADILSLCKDIMNLTEERNSTLKTGN